MSLFADYIEAASVSKRTLFALLWEALKLRLGHSRLGLSEYIDFQLYLDDLTFLEKKAFGGIRTQSILEKILIDDYSRFLSLDKITMYSLLAGYNFPIPHIRAAYRSVRPSSFVSLRSVDELEQYLRAAKALPVYIKRSFGSYGRGNTLISGLEGDNVILGNGTLEPITKFCASLDDARTLGWLLQEPLVSHPAVRKLTNSAKISGLRMHTFFSPSGAEVTKVIFKINTGIRDSDNFEHGASGNMLGAVDIGTGKVVRVIDGTGTRQVLNPAHPATGMNIIGFQIPYWSEILKLVKDAQAGFPGFICPGWDIALCQDGPKILEINAFGDIDLSQHAYRIGFLDDPFLSLMRQRGLQTLLYLRPGSKRRSAINNRLGVQRHHWPW